MDKLLANTYGIKRSGWHTSVTVNRPVPTDFYSYVLKKKNMKSRIIKKWNNRLNKEGRFLGITPMGEIQNIFNREYNKARRIT